MLYYLHVIILECLKMKADIEEIIKQLERAQDLLWQNKSEEATTVIYQAQMKAIFIRDHKTS